MSTVLSVRRGKVKTNQTLMVKINWPKNRIMRHTVNKRTVTQLLHSSRLQSTSSDMYPFLLTKCFQTLRFEACTVAVPYRLPETHLSNGIQLGIRTTNQHRIVSVSCPSLQQIVLTKKQKKHTRLLKKKKKNSYQILFGVTFALAKRI